MMKKKLILYIVWGISLFIMSCSDDNEKLPLYGDFEPLRFDFPQGTSVSDQEIQKIQEETGVYIIYKDITSYDLNRNWMDPDGISYEGVAIEDRDLAFYLKFLNDNLLKHVEAKYLKSSLPIYFYFLEHLEYLDDYYEETTVVDLRNDGMDFWALALSMEKIEELSVKEHARLRNRLVYPILEKLVNKGIVSAPETFAVGIDYKTALSRNPTTAGIRDPNYFRYRGFVDLVDAVSFQYTSIPSLSGVSGTNADFLTYIRIALYHTEDKFQEIYPKETYPLINNRYEIITSYLKKVYNIDLKAVASGS